VGAVVVPRLLAPEIYGRLQLTQSLYALWQFFNLTGVIPSAHTRLAEATGARNEAEIRELMGVYLRLMLLYAALSTAGLWLVGQFTPAAEVFYDGNREIITLAVVLTLTQPSEQLFNLFVIAHSSRRRMGAVARLQNFNQLMLTSATIIAVAISQTVVAVVVARLIYSYVTLIVAAAHYQRTRHDGDVTYPALGDIAAAISARPAGRELRFGFFNALDKNLGTVFMVLPVQMTGVVLGEVAAGYVGLALATTQRQNFFAAAVLDNLRAVIPRAVGRGDYARLWRNFNRVVLVLLAAVIGFYGLYALLSPLIVRVLYGETWLPVVPLIRLLAVFGALATLGGVFGPLYRAFNFMRGALVIKGVTLIACMPVGVWLLHEMGAAGGALMTVMMYACSVPMTILLTLPELRRRAGTVA